MGFVDLHCDSMLEVEAKGNSLRTKGGHLNLERMKEAGYTLQTFAMFVELEYYPNAYEQCMSMIRAYHKELEQNMDLIAPVYTYEDILKKRAEGKMSALLSLEEGEVCQGKVEYLRQFYELGARMMTLTWNFPNTLAWPNTVRGSRFGVPEVKQGLTEQGVEILCEMERLGMIVDVSHLGDAGFYQVMEHTKKPVIASHSNARAICPHVRNLTDDMIRRIAERGGVIGLNFCGNFVDDAEENAFATIEKLVGMTKYLKQVGGVECIALGSDFDGIGPEVELRGCEDMPLLVDGFRKAGFTAGEIEKICEGTALRMLRECL